MASMIRLLFFAIRIGNHMSGMWKLRRGDKAVKRQDEPGVENDVI